jgi:hypothetical protein
MGIYHAAALLAVGHRNHLEAAALRRDIAEARMHIDRLQRRYLSGDERTRQRQPEGDPEPQ